MFFGDKLITLDPSWSEEKIKKALFKRVQKLPNAETFLDQVIQHEQPFSKKQAKKIKGVLEKMYLVLSGKEDGGTDDLHICLGGVATDPDNEISVIFHIDCVQDVSGLDAIFAEFEKRKTKRINFRFFGGLPAGSPFAKGDEYIDSVAKAEAVYYYLYQKAIQYKDVCEIHIISSNTFEKLDPIRQILFKQEKSTKIGFAVSANGKVHVFKTHKEAKDLADYLPYTKVKNCGLFSKPFKSGHLNLVMRKYWDLPSEFFLKIYDGSDIDWEKNYLDILERKSRIGIIKILLGYLDPLQYIADREGTYRRKEVNRYIKENLSRWFKELFFHDIFFPDNTHLCLWHFRYFIAAKCCSKFEEVEEQLAKYKISMAKSIIASIMATGELQKWCIDNCCHHMTTIVLLQRAEDSSGQYENLLLLLQKIVGIKTLMAELVDYEKTTTCVGLESHDLISRLIKSRGDFQTIIEEWRLERIKNCVAEIVRTTINKGNKSQGYAEILQPILEGLIFNSLKDHIEKINIDRFSLSFTVVAEFRNELASIVNECIHDNVIDYLVTCFNPVINDEVIAAVTHDSINNWIANWLLDPEPLVNIEEDLERSFLNRREEFDLNQEQHIEKGIEKRKDSESRKEKNKESSEEENKDSSKEDSRNKNKEKVVEKGKKDDDSDTEKMENSSSEEERNYRKLDM